MSELAKFLFAQIVEDRAIAQAAVTAPERGDAAGWYWSNAGECICVDGTATVVVGGWKSSRPAGAHIERWDPERVLAECDAKWRIVELGGDSSRLDIEGAPGAEHDRTLKLVVLPFAGHRDYREEWRP